MSRIAISRCGADHLYRDVNCQDACISLEHAKIVLDGCGSGKYSEVGVLLFKQLIETEYPELTADTFLKTVNEIFERMLSISQKDTFCYESLCFTILACFETETEYVVYSCGDGYVIFGYKDQEVWLIPLDDGEYPQYYIYNFMNAENREIYPDGVNFKERHIPKGGSFTNVGVATDGMRYYQELNSVDRKKLQDAIIEGKQGKVGRLINRNKASFRDDITICV